MSERFPGGFITNNPTAPTTTSAPGIWTLDQATQYIKAGTWPYGGPFNYIEDVFQTWLYKGNSSTQTITNGIDLSTYGGLVWAKDRTYANSHQLYDTARGVQKRLMTDSTAAQGTETTGITAFNSNGWTMGAQYEINDSASNYASWTFRKQAKFFDVVTYTGDGSASLAVNHNLGSVPGCVIVKRTDSGGGWFVWHRATSGTPNNDYIRLEQTSAVASATNAWSGNAFTSTQFFVSNNLSTNVNGATYVAYLFAHNAGGFGSTNTDNVISCGSFTCDGSGNLGTVTLGYEPQWVLVKRTDAAQNWQIFDTMRGMSLTNQQTLNPNLSNAEGTWSSSSYLYPTATGFAGSGNFFGLNAQCIYIAIRRGPMKTPTSGTSVYNAISRVGTGTAASITGVGFPPDLFISTDRYAGYTGWISWYDKLRGIAPQIHSDSTNAEITLNPITSYDMNGITVPANNYFVGSGDPYIFWFFQRAPGFFDEVCYTGTGGNMTLNHNLGVPPELMIVKKRSAAGGWTTYAAPLGNTSNLNLNTTDAVNTGTNAWQSTTPTSTVFYIDGSIPPLGSSGATFVAYLFASCPGVSKVGSYTGNGSTQTINCGFTSGARFVLIKRTDALGDWYVYDTTRGMTTLTDPYLLMNGTGGEVATLGSVTTVSTGFALNASILAAINTNGASYIFLAIA